MSNFRNRSIVLIVLVLMLDLCKSHFSIGRFFTISTDLIVPNAEDPSWSPFIGLQEERKAQVGRFLKNCHLETKICTFLDFHIIKIKQKRSILPHKKITHKFCVLAVHIYILPHFTKH